MSLSFQSHSIRLIFIYYIGFFLHSCEAIFFLIREFYKLTWSHTATCSVYQEYIETRNFANELNEVVELIK